MNISKSRARLLCDLERIVGDECYNANIQNWSDFEYVDSGREFRYPVTVNTKGGSVIKERYTIDGDLRPEEIMTGRYKFGANELYIVAALNKVLAHLERKYGLRLNESESSLEKADPVD